MGIFDLRTIFVSFFISNAICALVMFTLWFEGRKNAQYLTLWLADYILQFVAVFLVLLRGAISDFISASVSNSAVIGGTLLLLAGLERFFGKSSRSRWNLALFSAFALLHVYFTLGHPSLQARNINLSGALLLISMEVGWLIYRRVGAKFLSAASMVGVIFAAYGVLSAGRIVANLVLPPGNDLFKSGLFDGVVILAYQMFFIGLTFALFLLVNKRLNTALAQDIQQRKRIEENLKESEKKFYKVFQTIPDAIVITASQTGEILDANSKFYALTGYTREETLGKTTSDMHLWVDPGEHELFIKQLRENESAANFEAKFLNRDGAQIIGLISGEFIRLKDGVFVLNVIHDITGRKILETSLRETNEYLDNLIGHANAPIITWDPARLITRFNHAFERLSQYSAGEVLGKHFSTLFPDTTYAEGLTQMEAAASGKYWESVEIPIRRRNGEIRIALWNFSNIYSADDSTLIATIAQGQDITERKQQEQELMAVHTDMKRMLDEARLSRRALLGVVEDQKKVADALRYRNIFIETILENAPIGFAVNRISDEEITFVNKRYETIYGFEKSYANARKRSFEFDYLEPLQRQTIQARMMADIDSGDPARMHWENIPIVTRQGTAKVISAMNIPIFEQDLLISVVQDVTEQRLAEEKIHKLNTELEQRVDDRTRQLSIANKELEAFAYSVSHDLRAPLRGIDGWSRILLAEYENQLDEGGRESLHFIRSETMRMNVLIENLLNLSRITRTDMKNEVINLSKLAETIVSRLLREQPRDDLQIVIQPDMIAYGDGALLEIGLTNILSNAWKFTGKRDHPRIEFGRQESRGCMAFYVRDNGAGFDMAYASKLFGVFQRLHQTAEFPGTGIGLAIVERIIHRHGGEIWALGQVNQGATFFFTLKEKA